VRHAPNPDDVHEFTSAGEAQPVRAGSKPETHPRDLSTLQHVVALRADSGYSPMNCNLSPSQPPQSLRRQLGQK
jgi:hypothetical protein